MFDCFTTLTVNKFRNKLVPNVPNKMLRIPPFSYFASFSIVSLTFILANNYVKN